jgi:hypothetical protein
VSASAPTAIPASAALPLFASPFLSPIVSPLRARPGASQAVPSSASALTTARPASNHEEPAAAVAAQAAGALHARVRAFHERWRARWRFWAAPAGDSSDAGRLGRARGATGNSDVASTTASTGVCQDVGRATVDLATQLRQPEQVHFFLAQNQ